MSEKKLLGFLSIEGILLLVLGFCVLILPRLTGLSFNSMLGIAFIVYGVFKFVYSIINRHLFEHFVCQMLLGVMIFVLGILLQIPRVDILWLIAFIGIYLVLEGVSAASFIAYIRNSFNFWHCKPCVSMILILAGIIVLVKLPIIAFSTVAVITGVCFILKGACKKMLGIVNANKEIYTNRNEDNYNRSQGMI